MIENTSLRLSDIFSGNVKMPEKILRVFIRSIFEINVLVCIDYKGTKSDYHLNTLVTMAEMNLMKLSDSVLLRFS